MKSLLWKDYRINRLLLIFGFVVCVGPWFLAVVRSDYLLWFHSDAAWSAPGFWISNCLVSLWLSVFTFAMLGGNAIAAERADRSAEFLAYLPVSRWSVIASKSLIAFAAGAAIWAINLVILFIVAPWFEFSYIPDEDTAARFHHLFAVCGAISVLLFGSGWFWSSVLTSHGLATGMSFVTLAAVVMGVIGLIVGCGLENFVEKWFVSVCVAVGIGGYIAGCAYYLHCLEDVFQDLINGRKATA
jgi:ABC-type transport system involved in multi-copper enzyme maturation permease subunit